MMNSSKTQTRSLFHNEPTITLFTDHTSHTFAPSREVRLDDVSLTLSSEGILTLQADTTPLRFLRLHWDFPFDPATTTILGDAWERSYGDLAWRPFDPSRWLPWYFFARTPNTLEAFGVHVQPATFALWSTDPTGPTLWLDLRSGSNPLTLHGRSLPLATLAYHAYEPTHPHNAACDFCHTLSPNPLPIPHPIYGSNNWYYAYGQSSRAEILADCAYIQSLCQGLSNRPYMVVDDGWDTRTGSGPFDSRWSAGNDRFGSMQDLAETMRSYDVRPGIWTRPLEVFDPSLPIEWMLHHDGAARYLDPSRPETLELVQRDIQRLASWGYQLIKHDFTSFDVFRRWGFQMTDWPAPPSGISFADTSRTSAEIILSLYRTILNAASPNALILGCNTFSHLCAGLVHINRIGDDTSGRNWDRTRRMGVNTLAYRLPQHNHFYQIDADCLGIRGDIPMSLNLQWAQLLALSATPFFASIQPNLPSPEESDFLRALFARASNPKNIHLHPNPNDLSTTPTSWVSDLHTRSFDWYSPASANLPDFAL